MMSAPVRSSPSSESALMASTAFRSATPPPGTMPSSSAALVACNASSTRCFFSFISVSVAAPTLITATPPASFASRSCSFSRSKSESVVSISAFSCLMRALIAFASPAPSRIVEHGLHPLGVGDHVRREVALVELHALGELELEPEGLPFLDVDDAVLADPVDRVGDDVADLALARGDRGDAGDVLLARDLLRLLLQVLDDRVDGLLDAALEPHRVRAGGDVLQALADDCLREEGRGRRAVAGDVVRRSCDLTDELRALILERVLDLDLACDRDTVVRDRRRAELLVEHDVPTLWAKGDLDRVGEDVHAALERAPRILVEFQLLVSH